MSRPTLSVVVPSFNGRHLLETCLASIARFRPETVAIEVIVVDDASTDGTAEWLRETNPEVRLVRRAANGGFVAAANDGIKAAVGEFVQLLNNDAEVTAGWVDAGLEPFHDPQVGSVAPLVLMRADPSRVDSAGDRYAVFGWPSKRGHGEPASCWIDQPCGPVFGASGSSAIYRRSALEQAGLFDPVFGSYYEDVDLAFRLRWAGYSCVHAPRCRVLHDVSASYDHARPELQQRMSRNAEVLFWSNLPTRWLIAGLMPHLVFTAVQAGMRLARGRFGPFANGKIEAWEILAKEIRSRRRTRLDFASRAQTRPHFPVQLVPVADIRNHLRRPERRNRIAQATTPTAEG